MLGPTIPIAILENKTSGVTVSREFMACVQFTDTSLPKFTANVKGKYFVIFQTETKRLALTIDVTSPASAAISRNSNVINTISRDQLMSLTAGGSVIQTRTWMPFEHVAHEFLVDMEAGEECIINVTSSASGRQWMLLAWRLGNHSYEDVA